MTHKIDNRQHPRMPITLPVRMVTATGAIEGKMENISRHGAFIRCQKPLEPGDRLIVVAKLPLNPSFNSYAEVVWSPVPRPDEEEIGHGIGVKFIDLTQDSLILNTKPTERDERVQAATF